MRLSDNCSLSLKQLVQADMSLLTVERNTASRLLKRRGQRREEGLHGRTATPGSEWKSWEGGGGHALNNKHNSLREVTQVDDAREKWGRGVECFRVAVFVFSINVLFLIKFECYLSESETIFLALTFTYGWLEIWYKENEGTFWKRVYRLRS